MKENTKRVNNRIIFIRHGATNYTGEEHDLTPLGVSQIQQTAKNIEHELEETDCTYYCTSPAPRAKFSQRIFQEEVDEKNKSRVKVRKDISPMAIKDLSGFIEYDKEHFTERYGEMFLTDPMFENDNHLTEGRDSLKRRSMEFLIRSKRVLDRFTRRHERSATLVVTTHFEVANNYLNGIFENKNEFPIESEDALRNGEAVVVEIKNDNGYIFKARGAEKNVEVDEVGMRLI